MNLGTTVTEISMRETDRVIQSYFGGKKKMVFSVSFVTRTRHCLLFESVGVYPTNY